jgi:predicted exporter
MKVSASPGRARTAPALSRRSWVRGRALIGTLLWAALMLAAAVIVSRARFTADLSAFLPETPTATQRLLVGQLREGIASRLIIVAIEGADAASRARVSGTMAERLRKNSRFTSVNNGDQSGLERDRAFLFDHRYVLSESVDARRFSVDGLKAAIQDTLDLLSSPAGLLVKSLIARDPTGEMVQVVDQVGAGEAPRTQQGVWSSRDGKRALLVAQTRAAGSDTDAQQQAIEAIRGAYAAGKARLPASAQQTLALQMSGPGVFSVSARSTIEHEVLRLSLLSTTAIVALLLAVYRSVPALILGLVPVASGALAGVAAVALGFGAVHGITLGFGITLIGESVDYSIYLFIQARRSWATIGLGVLTSICGFAALLPSGFPGLAQLGLYSISGLVAAALVTRFVLPHWLPRTFAIRDVTPLGVAVAGGLRRARGAAWVLGILALGAATVLYLHRASLWNRELSALSPVTQADQDLDARLRADIGAPDVRFLVVISGAQQESVLQAAERVGHSLESLSMSGVIGGFESPAHYLPSVATQRARQAAIPEATLMRARLEQATADLPLHANRLEPFLTDLESARARPVLTRSDLDGTSMAAGYDSMMLSEQNGWSAILPLRAATSPNGAYVDIDANKVAAAIAGACAAGAGTGAGADTDTGTGTAAGALPEARGCLTPVVLDLKRAADDLYSTYLAQIVKLSAFGLGAIIVLLLIALRSGLRMLRVVAPLALAVLVVAAGLVLAGRELTILHVIGMLLIVAVGSNYALFFDRRATDRQGDAVPLTLASLVIANASTVLGFGVLASSSVPILAALGSTVAPGALLALVFSALLAERLPVAAGAVAGGAGAGG